MDGSAPRQQVTLDQETWIFEVSRFGRYDGVWAYVFEPYLKYAQCFALVYSMTSRESFDNLRRWQSVLASTIKQSPEDPSQYDSRRYPLRLCAIIATKADLLSEHQVLEEEGKLVAQEFECPFFQVSLRTRPNVDEVFDAMGRNYREVMNRHDKDEQTRSLERLRGII